MVAFEIGGSLEFAKGKVAHEDADFYFGVQGLGFRA